MDRLPCLSLCRDSSSEAQLCQHVHVQAPSWVHLASQGHWTAGLPKSHHCAVGLSPGQALELLQPQGSQAFPSEPPPATPEPRLAWAALTQGPTPGT